MSRKKVRNKGQNRRNLQTVTEFGQQPSTFELTGSYTKYKKPSPLEAKNINQGFYISTILHTDITFGTGPAGTGKTYIAAALACEALENKTIDKIIISRPALPADEDFGHLPGDLQEKYAPYLQPFLDVFYERLGKGQTEYLIRSKVIEARPLAFMRGSTFSNCWVILDEAQNCTVNQMKMFLTRIGYNAKMVVNGDVRQSDLKGQISGLEDALDRFDGHREFGIVEFTKADCVRHGLTGKIISLYEY